MGDHVGSPTYAADLAGGLARLLSQGLTGTFHVTDSGSCPWYGLVREILRLAGFDSVHLSRITSAKLHRPARRPGHSALANVAWQGAGLPPLRPWTEAPTAMLLALPWMARGSDGKVGERGK